MRRIAARCLVLLFGLSLAACGPGFPSLPSFTQAQPPAASPVPSATPLLPTPTPTGTASPTPFSTLTFTPVPTFTATGEASTALPTASTGTPAVTGTLPTATLPAGTGTPLVAEPLTLDRLPANIDYKPVRIENVSHSQMDISLHCTTKHGLQTVLEYNSVRRLSIQAPDCDYVYVVYVGGRRIIGGFSLYGVPAVTITVYSDRVSVH